MARLSNTILNDKGGISQSEKALRHMVDIGELQSGQQGYRTDFEGYVSNSAYVKRNIIAVLVEYPLGFNHLPHPERWIRTLKALVELHPASITGLASTLTVNYAEHAVGGAGELQEDFSNVLRERTRPVFNWTEKYGKPINAFLDGWITNLMMDPITKVPNVMTRHGHKPFDLLPDYTGMTVLFIEPDPTHRQVVTSWLCTNMHPMTAGEVIGRRELTSDGELAEYSVGFTSLTQVGMGVDLFAQRYLDDMNLSAVNPNLKPAFIREINADIRKEISGYHDHLDLAHELAITDNKPDHNHGYDQGVPVSSRHNRWNHENMWPNLDTKGQRYGLMPAYRTDLEHGENQYNNETEEIPGIAGRNSDVGMKYVHSEYEADGHNRYKSGSQGRRGENGEARSDFNARGGARGRGGWFDRTLDSGDRGQIRNEENHPETGPHRTDNTIGGGGSRSQSDPDPAGGTTNTTPV